MSNNNNNNLDLILKSIDKKQLESLTRSKAITFFMSQLIQSGKLVKSDIVKATTEMFAGLKPITVSTYLTDSKNVKYNRFSKLGKESATNGIFSFVDNK